MTSEEAIALLDDQMNYNRIMEREWGNSMIETDAGKIVDGTLYANQHKDVADALELAIAALRAGVKDMNVPTMPAWQPLTLEQLRGMEGKPVWICRIEDKPGWWAIVRIGREKATTDYGGYFLLSDYGITWFAYVYPPAHIDREAWEMCECCRSAKFMNGKMMYNFCQSCGRPMTEEAWAELEKRVMGVKHYGT